MRIARYPKKGFASFSKEIDFIHPISGERLHFECELPKEFKDFIDNLK